MLQLLKGCAIKHLIVQLIEISTINNIGDPSERYIVEIKPLFEVHFVWISSSSGSVSIFSTSSNNFSISNQDASFTKNGSNGLYALPSWYSYHIGSYFYLGLEYENTQRNYINNFSFSGILANEQDANPGHSGYVAEDDYGHFFVGSDMHFSTYNINDLINPKKRIEGLSGAEAAKTVLGIASIFDPTPMGGTLLSTWDVIDLARNVQISALPDEHYYNYKTSVFEEYSYSTHGKQILYYEHLIKDCAILLGNENFALTLHGGESTFAKGIFKITQQCDKQNNWWISRFDVGFTFDVRRYGPNDNFSETVTWKKTEILGNTTANYKKVNVGETVNVYNYHQNTSRFSFTAPDAGYYKFDFVYVTDKYWYKNFDTSEIYLNAGQTYNLALEYLGPAALIPDISISELRINRADLKFTLLPGGAAYSVSGVANITNDIVIPSHYKGLPVTTIADNAFSAIGFTQLTNVEIPNTINTIGSNAFSNCTSLSVNLTSNVTSIGSNAFYNYKTVTMITPINPALTYNIASNAFSKIYTRGDYVAGLKNAWPNVNSKIHPIPVKINYDLQGGNSNYADYEYVGVYDQHYKLSNIPTKYGCFFAGWYSSANGTGMQYTYSNGKSTDVFTDIEDLTLYAHWITDNTHIITTKADLEYFAYQVNSGDSFLNRNVFLSNDIDLEGMEWTPINDFKGYFDGQGYKIYNFQITQTNYQLNSQYINVGLFGMAAATIVNLGVENFYIEITTDKSVSAGGLAGWGGIINNCFAIGAIQINSANIVHAGGLIGGSGWQIWDVVSSISDCYALVDIFAMSGDNDVYAGGLVGYGAYGLFFTNCFASGNVFASSEYGCVYAGGLVGGNEKNHISYCYATGNVTAYSLSGVIAGGLVGATEGHIFYCYTTGNVNANAHYLAIAGGLVGHYYIHSQTILTKCYAKGDVFALSEYGIAIAGGIVGYVIFRNYNYSFVISFYYAEGTVNATSDEFAVAGGLIGFIQELCSGDFINDYDIVINYCAILGDVYAISNGLAVAGGIIGINELSFSLIKNCCVKGNVYVIQIT